MSKTKSNEKGLKHITIERRPGCPAVVQRTVGPLAFSFLGPGPWEIQEDHFRLVSDAFQKTKKGKTGSGDTNTGQIGNKPPDETEAPPEKQEEKKK